MDQGPRAGLAVLENNLDIHAHACGEYLLHELQTGVSAEVVAKDLLSKYLVRATMQRVVAYRHYREQLGEYWTAEHLERLHWDFLYSLVSLHKTLGRSQNRTSPHGRVRGMQELTAARVSLCQELGLSEELVPLENLGAFFGRHERHARLPLMYADASVVKDAVPRSVVEAYEKTFLGEDLPETAFLSMGTAGAGSYERAMAVARDSKYIVFPKASADACLVVAYSLLKCALVFARQAWQGTRLTPIQATWAPKYDLPDFRFWVMYGSWSSCKACGSYFFNDKHFSEAVYQDQVTSTTPGLLAAHRRGVPDDPVCHASGRVGISSRWWYLPGMYTPSVERCHCCSGAETSGALLTRRMAERSTGPVVSTTRELYRIPVVAKSGGQAKECVSWPRYFRLRPGRPKYARVDRGGAARTGHSRIEDRREKGGVWCCPPIQLEEGGPLAGVLQEGAGHFQLLTTNY